MRSWCSGSKSWGHGPTQLSFLPLLRHLLRPKRCGYKPKWCSYDALHFLWCWKQSRRVLRLQLSDNQKFADFCKYWITIMTPDGSCPQTGGNSRGFEFERAFVHAGPSLRLGFWVLSLRYVRFFAIPNMLWCFTPFQRFVPTLCLMV